LFVNVPGVTRRYGAIEAGGTKFVCAIGSGPDDVAAGERFPTLQPTETIEAVIDFFAAEVRDGGELDGIGISSFGPVELRPSHPQYGHITTTTKAGWEDTDLAGPVERALGVPVGFDTDVNGAALGEGRWGAAQGLDTFVYMTIGTGIGVGAVVGGNVAHGLVHPEMGHVIVRRRPGDEYQGACPFHRDCLEGMASGPTLEARFGQPAEDLAGSDGDEAVALVAWYVADGLRSMVYTLAPQRIVIGGGVAEMPGLLPAIRSRLVEILGGYPGLPEHARDDFVVATALDGLAGTYGAFVLAERAAGFPAA
jgi:fructokinase